MAKQIMVSESATKKQQEVAKLLWGAKGKILIANFDALKKLRKKLGEDENALLVTVETFLKTDLDDKVVARLKKRKGFDTLPTRMKNLMAKLKKVQPLREKHDKAMKGLKAFSTLLGKEAGKMQSLSATKSQQDTAKLMWGAKGRTIVAALDALKKSKKKLDASGNELAINLDSFLRTAFDDRTITRLKKRKGFDTLAARLKVLVTNLPKLLAAQEAYNKDLKEVMKFNTVLGNASGSGAASAVKQSSQTAAQKAADKVLKERGVELEDPMKLVFKVARKVDGVKVVTAPKRDVVIPGMPRHKELKVGNAFYRFHKVKGGKIQLVSVGKLGHTSKVGKQIAFNEVSIEKALLDVVAKQKSNPGSKQVKEPKTPKTPVKIAPASEHMKVAIKVAKTLPGVKVVTAPKRDVVVEGAARPKELKVGDEYYTFNKVKGGKLQLVTIGKFGHTSKVGRAIPFTEDDISLALERLTLSNDSGGKANISSASQELAQGMKIARGIGFEDGEFMVKAMKAAGMKNLATYDNVREAVSFTAKTGLEQTGIKLLKQLKKNTDTSSSLMHIEAGKDRSKRVDISTYVGGKQVLLSLQDVGTGTIVRTENKMQASNLMFDGSKYIATPAALNLINRAKMAIPKTKNIQQTRLAAKDSKQLDNLKEKLSLGMTGANIKKAIAKIDKSNQQYLINEFPELGEI